MTVTKTYLLDEITKTINDLANDDNPELMLRLAMNRLHNLYKTMSNDQIINYA